MPGRFRNAIAVGVAILVLATLLAGSAHGPRPSSGIRPTAAGGAGAEWLNVSVSDTIQFALSTDMVTPGDSVHVVVTQLGSADHTFTLSSVAGYQFPQDSTPTSLQNYFVSHPWLININVTGGAGARFYGNFTAPPFGLYEYVCLKPGHFPRMSGILGSGEHGVALSVNTGPGAAVFIIAGSIAALVIAALALGFVVGRRRGSREEMPPERLGYLEPPSEPKQP